MRYQRSLGLTPMLVALPTFINTRREINGNDYQLPFPFTGTQLPFPFTGTIGKLTVKLGPSQL